jgi:phosphoglycerate dehydrogenase-like enzyme
MCKDATVPEQPHYTLVIASYLEPEHVERIRAVDPRIEVLYAPELLPPARYAADHYNTVERTPEQEARWRNLLGQADILFDFDYTHFKDLPELAPKVRWVQGSSAGIGQAVRRYGYDKRMPNTVFTTSSGVHAAPLAEFCLMAILMHNKGAARMFRAQARHHWERYAGTDLRGRTLGIIGVGRIGAELARLAHGFGMRVLGVKRSIDGVDPAALHLDALYGPTQLHEMLPQAEYLVLVTPHTDETARMIGAAELALLPRGAFLVNIGRGATLDEPALIAALRDEQLGGAALDVFAEEPLSPDSPLWDMPNVLISPHSGSTSDRENARITELFCENIRRYLAGEPLLNVLNIETLY